MQHGVIFIQHFLRTISLTMHRRVSTTARSSSENVTSRFWSHFWIIPSRLDRKRALNVPKWNPGKNGLGIEKTTKKFAIKCSRYSHNCKTIHFMSWIREKNAREMYKNGKGTCKACKTNVFNLLVKYANIATRRLVLSLHFLFDSSLIWIF